MIRKGGDYQKSRLLVPVLNWVIIKHHKNDNDNDDDDDYHYYYEDDRSVYG